MPDETVIDGEIVALDSSGKPSFNALQNGTSAAALVYYVFDVMILADRDVMNEPLTVRRELLREHVLANLDEPVREAPELEASLPALIASVKASGLEGLVAKRRDSHYEPRSALRRLAEDARQSWAAVRGWRVHGWRPGHSTPSCSDITTPESCFTPDARVAASRRHAATSYSGGSLTWRRMSAHFPTSLKHRAVAGAKG